MTPAAIIRAAQAEGVRLALSPTSTIKATGDGEAVNRWLAVIRERKAEIIDALKVGPSDSAPSADSTFFNREIAETGRSGRETNGCPATVLTGKEQSRQPSAPLTASEETAIRAWLTLVEETDPATIAEVIDLCQRDAEARGYFTGRAAEPAAH